MSIPNTLTIYINTKIPGYQNILYKPYMTNPKIDKDINNIYFDPLVRLNKTSINDVPENIVQNQFFNKGLFYTMENRVLSSNYGYSKINRENPMEQLKIAKENGTLNNNVILTLNTLFKPNTVIYIDNKPYTIYSYSWNSSSWTIGKKPLSSYYNKNKYYPSNFNRIPLSYGIPMMDVNIQNKIANEELKKIPSDLLHGENYDPEEFANIPIVNNNIVPSAPPLPQKQQLAIADVTQVKPTKPTTTGTTTDQNQLAITNIQSQPYDNNQILKLNDVNPLDDNTTTTRSRSPSESQITPPSTPTSNSQSTPPFIPKSIPTSRSPSTQSSISPPRSPSRSASRSKSRIKKNNNITRKIIKPSTFPNFGGGSIPPVLVNQNEILKSYFNNYYPLINNIYEKITNQKYTKNEFDKSINSFRIIKNDGGGNCFFISIAQGINNYNNKYNEDNKIKYKNKKRFEQKDIRDIVFNYYKKNRIILDERQQFAVDSINEMNKELSDIINEKTSKNETIFLDSIANSIFDKFNHPFLIIKPDENNKFFHVVDNNSFENYIKSTNFWADESVYPIIEDELKLKIITIANTGNNNFYLPFPNLTDLSNYWDKYIFLYLNSQHYELIKFNKTTIFDKNNKYNFTPSRKNNNSQPTYIIPPLYIVLFIYGFGYSKLDTESKKQVELLKNELIQIDKEYESIKKDYENNNTDNKAKNFLYDFDNLFRQKNTNNEKENIQKQVTTPLTSQSIVTNPQTSSPINNVASTIPTEQVATQINTSDSGSENQQINATNVEKVENNKKPTYKPQSFLGNQLSIDTKTSFVVVVDLELYPGTSIPTDKKLLIGCDIQYEKIRKSYAELTGHIYRAKPLDIYSHNYTKKTNSDYKNKNYKLSKEGGNVKKTLKNKRKL